MYSFSYSFSLCDFDLNENIVGVDIDTFYQ